VLYLKYYNLLKTFTAWVTNVVPAGARSPTRAK